MIPLNTIYRGIIYHLCGIMQRVGHMCGLIVTRTCVSMERMPGQRFNPMVKLIYQVPSGQVSSVFLTNAKDLLPSDVETTGFSSSISSIDRVAHISSLPCDFSGPIRMHCHAYSVQETVRLQVQEARQNLSETPWVQCARTVCVDDRVFTTVGVGARSSARTAIKNARYLRLLFSTCKFSCNF